MAATIALASSQLRADEINITPLPADPAVVLINQEEVSADEYKLVMERKAALVFSYFKMHHDVDDHRGYWSESTGPKGPLAKLREMTLEELVRIKAYQSLAKQKGLIRNTSFAAFRAEYEKENIRRAAAKKVGGVIYGPVQYRMPAYYYICFGDLAYKLKQSIAKECAPKITKEEIESFFEENKPALKEKSLEEVRDRIVEILSLREAEKVLDTQRASAVTKVKTPLLKGVVPRADSENDSTQKQQAQTQPSIPSRAS